MMKYDVKLFFLKELGFRIEAEFEEEAISKARLESKKLFNSDEAYLYEIHVKRVLKENDMC